MLSVTLQKLGSESVITIPVPAAAEQLVLGTMYLIVSQNLLLDLKQDLKN